MCTLPAVSWPPLAVSWVVSWPSRPYCGLSVAPRPASPDLCHDTNCCIVTHCKLKIGSSPTAFLHFFSFFFSSFFLFILFHLLEDPKKKKKKIYIYIYIYTHTHIYIHFPVEQINLLKFILFFFPVSHTIKP